MDTNLKKGKKIRAFCYRLFAASALAVTLISAIAGRDAIEILLSDGSSALSGKFYETPEFKDYIGELCYQAMLINAGIGDNTGASLYDSSNFYAQRAYADAKTFFNANLRKADMMVRYYIQLPDLTISTNMPYAAFSDPDSLPSDVVLCYYWDGRQDIEFSDLHNGLAHIHAYRSSMPYQPLTLNLYKMRVIIAVETEDYRTSPFLSGLQHQAENYQVILLLFIISSLSVVLSFPLCLFSRKAYKEASRSCAAFLGKILLEFKFTAIILSLLLLFYHFFSSGAVSFEESLWRILPVLLVVFMFFLLYTDMKYNKTGFFLHSLLGRLAMYIKELLQSVSWYRKSMHICSVLMIGAVTTLITAICLIATHLTDLFVIVFLCLVSLSLFLAYRHTRKLTKDIKAVSDKLAKLKDGTRTSPLILSKDSLMRETAEDVNALEDGMEKMAEQKNRSNKLRVELLTNVSHDLKTPLTSIINYADLLCEAPLSETAAGYAVSLRSKAYRLKSMVQDVFELSKATSGNLPIDRQTLDLVKLIRQTLADMEERIQDSSLTFKTIISEEPMLIEADGEKLYRVFQNLFVNALQYSLENSRVYIMLSVEDGKACAKVKNTSKWEIDFTPDDIMERFVRADASRTTEGSGLGLSIVQSFAEICGGCFSIETDADMFTACLRFPLTEKTTPNSANQDKEKESP